MDRAHEFLELFSEHEPMKDQLYVHSPRTLADVVAFAQGKGFLITVDDLEAALRDYPRTPATDAIRELAAP